MNPERATVLVDGLSLRGELYLSPCGEGAPAVCLCHGIPAGPPNPQDRGYPLLAGRLCQEGFTAFIFNFRGTGASQGNLDLRGWGRDLETVTDFLCARLETSFLSVMGSSAGAAAAVYVAAHDARISALALLACPANFDHLRRQERAKALLEHCRQVGTMRDPSYPPSMGQWVQGFVEVSPERWIGRIAPRPLLLVHGAEDELIPVEAAHRLYEQAGEPKELVILPGLGHRLRREEKAMAIAIAWLKKQANRFSPPTGWVGEEIKEG